MKVIWFGDKSMLYRIQITQAVLRAIYHWICIHIIAFKKREKTLRGVHFTVRGRKFHPS